MLWKRGVFVLLAALSALVISYLYFSSQKETFQLGDEQALLEVYVNETLLPDHIVQPLVVQHRLIDDGRLEGTNYTHGALWTSGDAKMYAFLHYTANLTALSDLGVLIELNKTVALDEATASNMLQEYVKQNYTVRCENGPNSVVVCEGFTTTKSTEEGAGVAVAPKNGFTLVFSCKHFKGGELFGMGSCIKRG